MWFLESGFETEGLRQPANMLGFFQQVHMHLVSILATAPNVCQHLQVVNNGLVCLSCSKIRKGKFCQKLYSLGAELTPGKHGQEELGQDTLGHIVRVFPHALCFFALYGLKPLVYAARAFPSALSHVEKVVAIYCEANTFVINGGFISTLMHFGNYIEPLILLEYLIIF